MDEQKRRYTFGNDEFSLEAAYHDCKLVFDGITDDDSFQEADTGLILYYANEIIYALHEALDKDTNVLSNDCISRQKAIDICTNAIDLWHGQLGEGALVAVQGRIKALPSEQPEQRWIPCSERMPKEKDAGILKKIGINSRSDYVLATVEVKGERMTVTSRTQDGVWDWNMKYAFPDYKVVAWMPLPKPWEGDKNE